MPTVSDWEAIPRMDMPGLNKRPFFCIFAAQTMKGMTYEPPKADLVAVAMEVNILSFTLENGHPEDENEDIWD